MAPLDKKSAEYNQLRKLIDLGERYAKSQKALAAELGCSRQAIRGWKEKGSDPGSLLRKKLEDFVARKQALQTDETLIKEASPSPQILLVGHISAGQLSMSDTSDIDSLDFSDLWRESPWWQYTDAGQPVLLVRVRGDSMAPTYPDKSLIAVRKPASRKLPNGAPCVFRDSGEMTFKLLMHRDDGGISGLPMNQDFDIVNFRAPEIDYVALGSIQPRMSVSMTFHPPPISKKRK